eukprot:GDKI01030495.1.p1 GENE.GDKI01030495.1~~GDKI01030495.1.p1  ORF type:complete len:274 (-),score=48.59 GDKI01030495.1:64-885(-)
MQESDFERMGDFRVSKPFEETNTQQNGVVLLLGWAGGQFKHILKYASVYRERGFRVVIAPSGLHDWSVSDSNMIHKYDKLLPVFNHTECLQGQRHRALVHMFSNGGSRAWWAVQAALETKGTQMNLAGVIVDSAPGVARAWTDATFLTLGISNAVVSAVAKPLLALVLMVSSGVYHGLLGNKSVFDRIWSVMLQGDLAHVPRLFLYSKTDILVAPCDVEACIEKSKSSGVSVVRSLCFEDSEHVRHLATHPLEYTGALDAFMSNDCGFARAKM